MLDNIKQVNHNSCILLLIFHGLCPHNNNPALWNSLDALHSQFAVLSLRWAQPLHRYAALHSSFTFVHPSSKHQWNPFPLSPCSHNFLSISRNKVSLWDDTLDFVIRRVGCSFIVADGDFVSVSLRKTAGENIYKDTVSYCWWKQRAKKWRNICGWSFQLSILKRWTLCDKAQWWSAAMTVHLLPAGISYAQLV